MSLPPAARPRFVDRVAELSPVECSASTGNSVAGCDHAVRLAEICPAEAREDDGQIADTETMCLRFVRLERRNPVSVGTGCIAEAADRPRTYNIEMHPDILPMIDD